MGKLAEILGLLIAREQALLNGIEINWRYPEIAPKNPLDFRITPGMQVLDPQKSGPWKANCDNWFYAEIEFPESFEGHHLDNSSALLYIGGWMPFQLWIDGKEFFRENQAWHATGPIVQPLSVPVVSGKKCRLVLKVRPTSIPGNIINLRFKVVFEYCEFLAMELASTTAQIQYSLVLAKTDNQRNIVEQATDNLDISALKENRWQDFLESIFLMENKLECFREEARKMTVHLAGHAHLDMDWLWTWEDTVSCIRRDFKAVVDVQKEYPEVTFTHSQVPTYKVVEKSDPEIFQQVKDAIKKGTWEPVTGLWVEGDFYLSDGEAFARHAEFAREWSDKNLGTCSPVLWAPDTFGHPANMPQLAKLAGFDAYYHWRSNPSGEDRFAPHFAQATQNITGKITESTPWPARIWQGCDGSEILALSQCYNGTLYPRNIMENVINHYRFGLHDTLSIWGLGDHGGALNLRQLKILDKYKNKPVMPKFNFATVSEYCKIIHKQKENLPRNQGESFHVFEGCFTTNAKIKSYNRQCEQALLEAETLAAIAGLDASGELRDAWKNVLFNQFHDIIAGTSVAEAYENAYSRAGNALAAAKIIRTEACRIITEPVTGKKSIINTLGVAYTGPVDGSWVENVPPFSVVEMDCRKTDKKLNIAEESGYFLLETDYVKLRIQKESGVIVEYFSKKLKRDLLVKNKNAPELGLVERPDFGLNVLSFADETPNSMTAWLNSGLYRKEPLIRDAETKLVSADSVCAVFKTVYNHRNSNIIQTMIVYGYCERIDFIIDADWHEKGSDKVGVPQLRMQFNSITSNPVLTTDTIFGWNRYNPDGKTKPQQKWADLSGTDWGFTIFNDSVYACETIGTALEIPLLRNAYFPAADLDSGSHRFRLSYVPHLGPCDPGAAVKIGLCFQRRPLALKGADSHNCNLPFKFDIDSPVICTSLTKIDSGFRIRLFNPYEKEKATSIDLNGSITGIELIDFTGKKIADLPDCRKLHFAPFEIKTLLFKK